MSKRFVIGALKLLVWAGGLAACGGPETPRTIVPPPPFYEVGHAANEPTGAISGGQLDKRLAALEVDVATLKIEISRLSTLSDKLEGTVPPVQATPTPSGPPAVPTSPPVAEAVPSTPAATPAPSPRAPRTDGGLALQLAAFGSAARAEAAWVSLRSQGGTLLADLSPKREEARIGGQTFYRLKAGPFADAASARTRCGALKAQGIACLVAPFTGEWN